VKHHIKDQYKCDPKDPKSMKYTPDVGRIIASWHLDRVEKIMKEAESDPNTKIEFGGSEHIYKEDLYVAPTVYTNVSPTSAIMNEEIFAPILPIASFRNFDDVINEHILSRGKPLAIYFFGKNNENY
jgi:aldehyde dehydrogenase (NAD+)